MASQTETQKVPVYSLNDLKNTTDDALTPYLCTLPQPYTFKRDNTHSNVRLVLGFTAVAIAAVTFYLDRQLGWEAVQATWVRVAVVVYFTLNSILTVYIWAVEAGEVFRGRRKTGETIYISSSTTGKHSPLYRLKVRYVSASGNVLQQKEIEAPFTSWFSADGMFHPEPFRRWLASEITVLGEAARETERKTGNVSSHVGIDEKASQKKSRR
ncbi:hypothetical protein VTN31DRAFT_2793 [Thermomyces dupontii]|uniref:uncharacterized protein n=1 Tax=Talaromyces thermophilus TaxID=28565 RepID=UPI0037444F0E